MLERVQHKIVKKNQNRAKKAGSTTQSRRWHNQRVDKDQVVEKKYERTELCIVDSGNEPA